MKKLVILLIFILTATTAFAAEMTLSEQATALYSQNDIQKAFDTIGKIAENDRTAQDWLLLGNILQDQGKTPEAIFMFKRSALVDNKFYKAYYNLGNIYLEEDRPFLALDEYKKVVKLKDDFAYVHYNMGCAYIKAGDLKKARKAFLRAIELKNTEPKFYYNLIYVYKTMGKDKNAKTYLEIYNKMTEQAQ